MSDINNTISIINNNNNGDGIDVDQFEQLSTLMLHKMLDLPLVDIKVKQLQKPKKTTTTN